MALRLLTRQESGERLRWLRRQANLSGRALGEMMGAKDTKGHVSKLERGIQLSHEWMVRASIAMAGEGQLVNDDVALLNFMVGATHDERSLLVPRFGIVAGDADQVAYKACCRQTPPHLRERAHGSGVQRHTSRIPALSCARAF